MSISEGKETRTAQGRAGMSVKLGGSSFNNLHPEGHTPRA